MRPFGVLLLLLTCQLATPTPIFDKDGASLHREYRSAGVGDTIRDWFRILKNRIVGKWQEWFGNDDPTFTAQDILNIDKTIESRVPGYPGLFLDLSCHAYRGALTFLYALFTFIFVNSFHDTIASLSLDPKQDWGVRIGNWYVIRKVTGHNYNSDSDSDEWDMRPLIPNLPSTPILGINWTPNWIPNVQGFPESMLPAITTPKIEPTTLRRTTSQTVDETVITSTEPHLITAELTPLTTLLITTSPDSIVATTDGIHISNEADVTNNENALLNNSTVTFTVSDVISESTIIESASPESTVTSTESTATDIESDVISSEKIPTTEPPTSTELILSIFNKRVEDNETVDRRTTKKPRPASAEVIF